jgi:hypothetical protein
MIRGRAVARGWTLVSLLCCVASGFGQTAVAPETRPVPAYRVEPMTGGWLELRRRFNHTQLARLEKLNRRDLQHLGRSRSLVVPEPWDLDELAYSPLPAEYPAVAAHPKFLLVHQPMQVFGAYESGRLVRWGPVSTGRRSRLTPVGLFHLNWRSPGRHSTVDPEWYMRWYFNFDNKRGLSLHEYELPGYAASHACVRLLARDARWLFDWGEEWQLSEDGHTVIKPGTPLLIVGTFAFGEEPPWMVPERLAQRIELPTQPVPP